MFNCLLLFGNPKCMGINSKIGWWAGGWKQVTNESLTKINLYTFYKQESAGNTERMYNKNIAIWVAPMVHFWPPDILTQMTKERKWKLHTNWFDYNLPLWLGSLEDFLSNMTVFFPQTCSKWENFISMLYNLPKICLLSRERYRRGLWHV